MKSLSLHERVVSSRDAAGFTLVELMIVVLIIGILAAISTPVYLQYLVRTNRAAAKGCMSEYSQFMERYYTTNLSYVNAAPVLGCASEGNLNAKYTIDAHTSVAPTQRTYTVTAVPIGAQFTRDARCRTLTLDQAGTRGKTGTDTVAYCWQ